MSDLLVVGATGRVGGLVAEGLDALGRDYAVMSSRPEAARERFGDVRHGDMRAPETLAAALEGIDAVFLVTPLGPDETACGTAFLDAAEAAGVRKVVYVAIMNIGEMAAIPHFATKIPVRERLLAGGPHVSVDANFFMQNDLFVADAIAAGLYPLPIGEAGVNAVDARDVATVCVRALTTDALDGQAAPVCGEAVVTGPVAAAAYAEALGRPVAYPGDDTAPFLAKMREALPPMPPSVAGWVQEDLRLMMEVTQSTGCLADEAQHAACRAALGRAPRGHGAFVAETAAGLRP